MKKLVLLILPFLLGLAPGDKVPPIAAKNQHGKNVSLDSYKGRYVLIYFYPKDDTPGCTAGCTAQAQGLRDKYGEFKKLNAAVLGVSRQDEKSHQEFIAKYKLPFDLLVDSDGGLGKSLGIGSIPVLGFSKRQSVLVGPEGKVLKFYDEVKDPSKHADEVLKDIKQIR
jgi:thioredoxin-dependent peroxiredoxin